MLFTDFIAAMAEILMRRLKMNDWDSARLIKENSSKLERGFHEGFTPLDGCSLVLGYELEEDLVTPEEAETVFNGGANYRKRSTPSGLILP